MSDHAVRDLARRMGIAVEWTNAAGKPQAVAVPVLQRLLAALGVAAANPREIADSRARLDTEDALRARAPLVTAVVDAPILLPNLERLAPASALLVSEAGDRREIVLERSGDRLTIDAIAEPGYHELRLGNRVVMLAVAPRRCFTPQDIEHDPRLWGVAVQLYGLRHAGDGGIGNTAGLSAFAAAAANSGADAIALSPTHAMFGADLSRYGPYSPSSRLLLNPLYADPGTVFTDAQIAAAIGELGLTERWSACEAAALIDWPEAAANKLAVLRRFFDTLNAQGGEGLPAPLRETFAAFRRDAGDAIEQHALFEALHASRLAADPRSWSWRDWPSEWRHPDSADVRDFAAAHAGEIAFQIFLQWIADRSLGSAQAAARKAGMRIGLIADLAIGMDAAGSHAWARQQDLVVGLNVGAPPDIYNPRGQNWGLTAFSPRALVAGGFATFIATLRATLRHAGGVRIDHAMGLRRLWLVPEGASPTEGAYLTYPLDDLVRLIKLESFRHRAVVIGEDLGTVPTGFGQMLTDAGIAGMRVLWFEREKEDFRPPRAWSRDAVAMTSTHDLPTVAGWWRGVDIDTRAKLGLQGAGENTAGQKKTRARDRALLWAAFREAGVVTARQAMPDDAAEAVDAAVKFVAATPSHLAIIPLEDMLGLPEQPNLPGTVDQHPNWRRRYPGDARTLFQAPQVARRARFLSERRRP